MVRTRACDCCIASVDFWPSLCAVFIGTETNVRVLDLDLEFGIDVRMKPNWGRAE